jgi:hypothetical protein
MHSKVEINDGVFRFHDLGKTEIQVMPDGESLLNH